jgi:nucleoside-diphosphate-sugar epimerase
MRVLVTGATGFIGRCLVNRLLSQGYEVRALVRGTSSLQDLNAGAERAIGDLTDPESLRQVLQGVDLVYNCAGSLGTWGVKEEKLHTVNVTGVRNLLAACLASSVQHIIHLSTGGVTGPVPYDPVDETYACHPSTPYERTKWQGEQVAVEMARTHHLPLTVVRPTFTYGPGDLHKLPLFRAVRKGLFAFVGSGASTIHPVYIDDLLDGLELCAAKAPQGAVYIIGGEKPVSKRELIGLIAARINVPPPRIHLPVMPTMGVAFALEMVGSVLHFEPPLTRSRVLMFSKNWGYSIAKARKELGYCPRFSLDKGIRQTVRWYQEKGYL